jgi:hypothetical protein
MAVFLVDLEAVETRYTGQWKTHVPSLLEEAGHAVTVIQGPTDIPNATTPGAFLNFGGTNIYKARQVEEIARLFTSGKVVDGDHFLFTDAWHPGIINLKYMAELLNVKIKIHALWHAGSYDPQDFLGRLIGDKPWVRHSEQAFFHAVDHNYFATDFHINMFSDVLGETVDTEWRDTMLAEGKIVRTGWPMEYMPTALEFFKQIPKRDLILFPHRIAPEKQVEIFRDLAVSMPEYEWIVCQDQPLNKLQYHGLLGTAKMVFSANLQETLGISCYEGALVNAMPFVPDRLSYSEMYNDRFKYPSEMTESWDSYQKHKPMLMALIRVNMEIYQQNIPHIQDQANTLTDNFFSAGALLENIK